MGGGRGALMSQLFRSMPRERGSSWHCLNARLNFASFLHASIRWTALLRLLQNSRKTLKNSAFMLKQSPTDSVAS